jgi:mono/diheme cytochrome c family protein
VGLLALSTPATIALIAGIVIALAFVGGLIALAARRRGERGPDIPPGMRPGPPDAVLERRHIDRTMAWGVGFMLLIAPWLAVIWLGEPSQNVEDEIELISRSTERGGRWFQVSSEENPTGFGCARCHGQEAQGGTTPFTQPNGETVEYPVPSLSDVCSRLTIEDPGGIRQTIEEGREGTPMPSWSIRFAGPMNDQQIQDLINYLVSINEENVPADQNLCINPDAAEEAPAGEEQSPSPQASPTEGETG